MKKASNPPPPPPPPVKNRNPYYRLVTYNENKKAIATIVMRCLDAVIQIGELDLEYREDWCYEIFVVESSETPENWEEIFKYPKRI